MSLPKEDKKKFI